MDEVEDAAAVFDQWISGEWAEIKEEEMKRLQMGPTQPSFVNYCAEELSHQPLGWNL